MELPRGFEVTPSHTAALAGNEEARIGHTLVLGKGCAALVGGAINSVRAALDALEGKPREKAELCVEERCRVAEGWS